MDATKPAADTTLTREERATLEAWAGARRDAIAFPFLTSAELCRLRFVRWRRERGLLRAAEPVSDDTEALCAALLAWRPPTRPVWRLCTPWQEL